MKFSPKYYLERQMPGLIDSGLKMTLPLLFRYGKYVFTCVFPVLLPSGVVYVSGCVYAVGGFNGSLRVRTVDCYDPMMDRWTSVSSMQDRRSTLGAAVLNGLLYAVGGFDGSTGTVVLVC